MKILWLYQYSSYYNYDKWFHLELVRWMKNNGIGISAYGPNLEIEYKDIVDMIYDPQADWEAVVKATKSDVAIFNTKSRMFANYHPIKKVAEGEWLPKGWSSSKLIPKIMIEEDYHYETDDLWYKTSGFSVVLQRHYSQSLRGKNVKMLWHPFSVDTSIFKSDNRPRTNKICFAGSSTTPYPERNLVCYVLQETGLLDAFKNQEKRGDNYIDCLKTYTAHVSGSSIYDITAAKNFEIAAAGSVLFTNRFSGLDLIFNKDSYVEYTTQADNIRAQARKIINEPEFVKKTVESAMKDINERHTNKIRTEELIKLIKENS